MGRLKNDELDRRDDGRPSGRRPARDGFDALLGLDAECFPEKRRVLVTPSFFLKNENSRDAAKAEIAADLASMYESVEPTDQIWLQGDHQVFGVDRLDIVVPCDTVKEWGAGVVIDTVPDDRVCSINSGPSDLPDTIDSLELQRRMKRSGLLINRRTVKSYQHAGSFSSSLHVRVVAGRLTVSGNPSRYSRRHNVTMLTTVDECLAVYDRILVDLGLPSLRDSTGSFSARIRIARIDVTRQFYTGDYNSARRYLRAASMLQLRGEPGHLYPNGNTVDWGGSKSKTGVSTRRYVKLYLKGSEHKLRNKHYGQLLDDNGVIRHEVQLRTAWLTSKDCDLETTRDVVHSLAYAHNWRLKTMATILQLYPGNLERVSVNEGTETAFEKLLAAGCKVATATRLQGLIEMWSQGIDLKRQMKTPTFYRERKSILDMTGVDIGSQLDISKTSTQSYEIPVRPGLPAHILDKFHALG